MTLHTESVHFPAANPVLLSNELRGNTLWNQVVDFTKLRWVGITRTRAGRAAHWNSSHRFDAAGNTDVNNSGLNEGGSEVYGGLTGAAGPTYGRRGCCVWESCGEPRSST